DATAGAPEAHGGGPERGADRGAGPPGDHGRRSPPGSALPGGPGGRRLLHSRRPAAAVWGGARPLPAGAGRTLPSLERAVSARLRARERCAPTLRRRAGSARAAAATALRVSGERRDAGPLCDTVGAGTG